MSFRLVVTLIAMGWLQSPAVANSSESELQYVLDRYLEVMGGSAALEGIVSVYMTGVITLPDETRIPVSILKKRPNKVRIVQFLNDWRYIRGYDGERAWIARESDEKIILGKIDEQLTRQIAESAPMENILVDLQDTGAVLELAEEVIIARSPCYKILAHFPDGSRREFLIEKGTFLDRRMYNYDPQGNLLQEFIPGSFTTVNGVLFAMKQLTLVDGKVQSTLVLDEVQINLGILDDLFKPPAELSGN